MELFPNLDTPGVNEYIWRFSQTVLSRGQRINMELFPNCTLQGSKNTFGIFPKLYTLGVKEYICSFSQTVHSRGQRIQMEFFPNCTLQGVKEYISNVSQTVHSRGQRIHLEMWILLTGILASMFQVGLNPRLTRKIPTKKACICNIRLFLKRSGVG